MPRSVSTSATTPARASLVVRWTVAWESSTRSQKRSTLPAAHGTCVSDGVGS